MLSQAIAVFEKYCGVRTTAGFVYLVLLGVAVIFLNSITTNALEITLKELIVQAGVTITGMETGPVKTTLILAWSVIAVQWATIIVLLLVQFVTGRPQRTPPSPSS